MELCENLLKIAVISNFLAFFLFYLKKISLLDPVLANILVFHNILSRFLESFAFRPIFGLPNVSDPDPDL